MNTFRRTLITLLALGLILALVMPAAMRINARQDEPVTLYVLEGPQGITTSLDSITFGSAHLDNLYLGLAATSPISGQPTPQLATGWTVSGNSLVWTFTLRDDVPWVHWDATNWEAVVLRMVTAHDVAYGLQRACDPRVYPGESTMFSLITGCDDLLGMDPDYITDADYELVQVKALDDMTVEITLNTPAAYFLTMLTLPVGRPVPRDLVEQYGDAWADPSTLATNGPFLVEEWIPGTRLLLTTNPWLPDDLRGPGNIERIDIRVAAQANDRLIQYQADQIDVFELYSGHAAIALQNFPEQLYISYGLNVHNFWFAYGKPPFDDVHVRRAFSAAFNRQALIDSIRSFPLLPMIHFTSPGVPGAPPLDQPGVGYDPVYAREQLALAGYPDCQGFPETQILAWDVFPIAVEYLVTDLVQTLGCSPDIFTVEELSMEEIIARTESGLPMELFPDIWFAYWGVDFADAHNYVGMVLSCTAVGGWGALRPCSGIDDLIEQAAYETDIAWRTALYWDIEERFYGPEGLFPTIPILLDGYYYAMKPWLDGPIASDSIAVSGMHFDWYTIDQEAQLVGRGGE